MKKRKFVLVIMSEVLPCINKRNNDILNNKSLMKTPEDENKESITLIRFDPSFGLHEDIEQTKQQLRYLNDYLIIYTDLDESIRFIQSISKEKIFLIISGSEASQLLSQICSLHQLDSIFILTTKKSQYEYLLDKYSKIIGIYDDFDDLYQSIEEKINLVDTQLQTFSYFDQNQKIMNDLSKTSNEFLWYQLFNYVIKQLPKNQQPKEQMIKICKQYYQGNLKQLQLIDHFQDKYQSQDAIQYYLKQSFIYQLINKALTIRDIDQLHIFQFFINDLSENLEREHEKLLSSEEEILIVYRGTKMNKEDFNKLEENQGQFISTNGYLSATINKAQAFDSALKSTKRTDIVSVIFQIECHVQLIGKNLLFAQIEKDILFDFNVCFTIDSIEQYQSIQLIKMTLSNEGENLIKDYIKKIQDLTEQQSIMIIFVSLMCKLGEYDKSQRYF